MNEAREREEEKWKIRKYCGTKMESDSFSIQHHYKL